MAGCSPGKHTSHWIPLEWFNESGARASGHHVCSVDSLNSGQTATFTVLVRTAETGKMDFAASAYGADADPNLDNNYATGRFGGALLLELLLLSIGLVMARSSRAGFVKPH